MFWFVTPYFNRYHEIIEREPPRVLRQHVIHQPMIKWVLC